TGRLLPCSRGRSVSDAFGSSVAHALGSESCSEFAVGKRDTDLVPPTQNKEVFQMIGHWLTGLRRHVLCTSAALLVSTGVSQAGDNDAELRAMLQQQAKQIQELKKQLDSVVRPVTAEAADPAKPTIDEGAVQKIVADYLK